MIFFFSHLSLQICAKICEHWGCKWKPLVFHSVCASYSLAAGFVGFCFSLYAWKIASLFLFFCAFLFLNFSLLSPQLAQGQDGSFRRFAVLEFATAEMAEEAQRLTDGRLLGGTHIRVSFCAPGPPGRSMLAALIAAQTMVLYSNLQSLLEPLRHNIAAFEFDIPAVMERVRKCIRFSFFGESVLMCGPTLHPMLQERCLLGIIEKKCLWCTCYCSGQLPN